MIMPVVLYGSETQYLTSREEYKLRINYKCMKTKGTVIAQSV
jgi:hypothetical protein